MSKKKKQTAVKITTKPHTRETNDILCDTTAGSVLLDTTSKDMTTEALLGSTEPQGSTRNDLTITFRYNFDRITKLKEIALAETKKNWEEDKKDKTKPNRKTVQYTDLMRRAIDKAYFGGK